MTITTPLTPEQIAQYNNYVFELSAFTTTGYKTYRWFTATSYEMALKLMREVAVLFHSSYDMANNRSMNWSGWELRDELAYRIHGYHCIEDFLDTNNYDDYRESNPRNESLIIKGEPRTIDEIYNYMLSEGWLTCYPANQLYSLSQIDGD